MKNEINLSNNILRLRHERKLTQEALAEFMGVTKASVSKWETGKSTPDILILSQMASFFDVTIDELVGYEAWLTDQQIRRYYKELVRDFTELPFHGVLEKVRSLARRYCACYPFLLQLVVLYWNHYMLAETEEEGRKILQEAMAWCDRIQENCGDSGVCSEALVMKAGLSLSLGMAAEALEALEPISDPGRFTGQSGLMLIQAYEMAGENEKARSFAQAKQYQDLLNLVSGAALFVSLYERDLKRCDETVRRIRGIIELYQLEELHPNMTAQFHYRTAAVYGGNGKRKEALEALKLFEKSCQHLLKAEEITLHGDAYFDLLDAWIEKLPLGRMAPRDRSFLQENLRAALSHPAFGCIRETREFKSIESRLCDRQQGGVHEANA